jgi:hypothetical protein
MTIPIIQTRSQFLIYLLTSLGFSLISPVIMNVVMEMNRKANGRGAVVLLRLISVTKIMAVRPANTKNDKIVTAFIMCFIRSTSIVEASSEKLSPVVLVDYRPMISIQKGCV